MSRSIPRGLRTVALAALLVLVTAASGGQARAGDNLFGGKTVRSTNFYFVAGFPDIELGARFPILDSLDIGPRLGFAYGRHVDYIGCCEFSVAGDGRYQVFDLDGFTGAFMFSVPLNIRTDSRSYFNTGLAIYVNPDEVDVWLGIVWPGFAMTYDATEAIELDFGLQLQDSVSFSTGVFNIVTAFFFGVEAAVTDAIDVIGKMELGPDIYTGGDLRATYTWFRFRFVAGISVAL